MIGPDQWVEARIFATVTPNATPPEGVTTGRWIDIDLAEQTLAVYDNYQLVFATVIASGLEPFWTRPGLFQIYQKKETETMRNNDPTDYYYLDNVPWTMYFDKARALHGAYWRTRFGYPQSHGCVNLSVGDAHWLFNWAHEGDYVYVHDPSGLTPTDPALYHDCVIDTLLMRMVNSCPLVERMVPWCSGPNTAAPVKPRCGSESVGPQEEDSLIMVSCLLFLNPFNGVIVSKLDPNSRKPLDSTGPPGLYSR
jgi:hypothetical protein